MFMKANRMNAKSNLVITSALLAFVTSGCWHKPATVKKKDVKVVTAEVDAVPCENKISVDAAPENGALVTDVKALIDGKDGVYRLKSIEMNYLKEVDGKVKRSVSAESAVGESGIANNGKTSCASLGDEKNFSFRMELPKSFARKDGAFNQRSGVKLDVTIAEDPLDATKKNLSAVATGDILDVKVSADEPKRPYGLGDPNSTAQMSAQKETDEDKIAVKVYRTSDSTIVVRESFSKIIGKDLKIITSTSSTYELVAPTK